MENVIEKLKELRLHVEHELEFCNIVDTPYVCNAIHSKPEEKNQIINYVVELVVKKGITISMAIAETEFELNPRFTNG
jgi:hypothetical protein